MCQVCIMQSKSVLDGSALRASLRKLYSTLSATLASKEASSSLRQFYIETLRKTADEIESNVRAEAMLEVELKGVEGELRSKVAAVEKHLLKEETEFYTKFGMVMPDEVRATIRLRIWDSLEQENEGNDRTEREPSSIYEGIGGGQAVPSRSESQPDGYSG